jgi:hypothetical protein
MKKRYLYALLFGVPGLLGSGLVSLFLLGVLWGLLWIYVFGDNSWPTSAESIVSLSFVLVFFVLWLGSISAGYAIGKRLETDPGVNKMHILVSGLVTAVMIALILVQQWSVGNLGPKSDALLCSDFCSHQGYSASGMPPANSGDRTCSCYDGSGKEVLKIPLKQIAPGASR